MKSIIKMTISVIIPAYNKAPYIHRCLESVARQKGCAIECIIVDDSSTDDTVQVIEDFISNHHKDGIVWKMICQKSNRGVSVVRNIGLEQVSGDYVFFLDADDSLTDNSLELLCDLAQKYELVDVVQGDYHNDWGSIKLTSCFDEVIYKGSDAKDAFLDSNISLSVCNKLIKTSIAKTISFEEGIINEDNLWCFFLYEKMSSLCVCNEETYVYYNIPNSIMHSKNYSEKSLISFKRIYDVIIHEMENMQMDRAFPLSKILDRYVFGFVLMRGADKETFKATQYRLYMLCKNNRRFLSKYDRYVAFALRLPYPLITQYALFFKNFMVLKNKIEDKFHRIIHRRV